MSLLVPWIGLPLVLGLLSLGCAQALEIASGVRVARALILPIGFAVVIVAAQALTAVDFTAKLATPAVVLIALGGLVASRRRARRVIGPWLIAALVVYLAYGAPVLASGTATFAGYRELDDTSSWISIIDHVMSHGRGFHGLAPSSYQATMAAYLGNGYPLGGFLALGVTKQLLPVDLMWLYQPFLAYTGAMLALALYELVRRLVSRRALTVAIASISAQPAILYGYSLWGGIKEMVAAAMLPLVAALAGERRGSRGGWRATLPLAVACSALLATLSLGAIVWVIPLTLPALVAGTAATRRAPWRALRLPQIGWLAAVAALCSLPTIVLAETFLRPLFQSGPGAGGVFTNAGELGNLPHRLDLRQLLGIWPAEDFRASAIHIGIVDALLLLVVALGVLGVVVAWRRGQRALPAYVLGAVAVSVAIHFHSSPWADGKSLAQSSPAILLAALAMAAIGWDRRSLHRLGWVAGGVLAIAVLWSNVLAYRGVSLAPRDQLDELVHIAGIADGHGPTLVNDGASIAGRYILRGARAVNPNKQVRLRDGSLLPHGAQADIDQFDQRALATYRQLVLRRAPDASRPPAAYQLSWTGRFYQLWTRSPIAPQTRGHLALGGAQAAAVPRCRDILFGAGTAGPSGHLAAVARDAPIVVGLGKAPRPGGWRAVSFPGAVVPTRSGTMVRSFSAPESGRWQVWLTGTTRAQTTLSIDGRELRSVRHELDWIGRSIPFGTVALTRGAHRLSVRYAVGGWKPGDHGQTITPDFFGPVRLSREPADLPVFTVPASRARSLCGKRLDWVEILP